MSISSIERLGGETGAQHKAAQDSAGRKRSVSEGRVDWIAYLFIAFFALPFVAFNVLPALFGVYLSFTNWSIMGTPSFVGLENYSDALVDADLRNAFVNTIRYACVIVPGVVVLGYFAALFVNQKWYLSGVARAMFFAPNVVAGTVVAIVWVGVLDNNVGPLNKLIQAFGGQGVAWLTNTHTAWLGVSFASVWWDLGLAFVLFLAAQQEVPVDQIEAATIDGANWLQRVWYIVLPHTWPTVTMVVTLQLISTLRIFSQVYLMTAGGPAGSTMSVIQLIYDSSVTRSVMGYAATISTILFIVILGASLIKDRILARTS